MLQPLAIAGVAFVAVELIDGTRWLAVFAPLLVLLVVWLGQAIHAHRRAIVLGAQPGGEIQVAAFLPLALAVVTLFWMFGGRHGSPAATVQAYMEAWMDNRPDAAGRLFQVTRVDTDVANFWSQQAERLRGLIASERARYGPASGLDPTRPFASLRVTQFVTPPGTDFVEYIVELVRSERYETTMFGVIPTAAQRTVAVEPIIGFDLREELVPNSVIPTTTWRIYAVSPRVWTTGNIVSDSPPTILTTPLSGFSFPATPIPGGKQ
ncbi:MAG: hypothetical protein ABI797_04455 [Chloroflexota bacterium]